MTEEQVSVLTELIEDIELYSSDIDESEYDFLMSISDYDSDQNLSEAQHEWLYRIAQKVEIL